jgi:hypothetical protein
MALRPSIFKDRAASAHLIRIMVFRSAHGRLVCFLLSLVLFLVVAGSYLGVFAVPSQFADKRGDGGNDKDDEGTAASLLRKFVLDGKLAGGERREEMSLTTMVAVGDMDVGMIERRSEEEVARL